jgi:hypothetical protein
MGAPKLNPKRLGTSTRCLLSRFRRFAKLPPFTYATIPVRFIVKCHLASRASIAGMRGLNNTLACLMNVQLYFGGNSYVLSMNRGEFPDTNDALVTCTEPSALS